MPIRDVAWKGAARYLVVSRFSYLEAVVIALLVQHMWWEAVGVFVAHLVLLLVCGKAGHGAITMKPGKIPAGRT